MVHIIKGCNLYAVCIPAIQAHHRMVNRYTIVVTKNTLERRIDSSQFRTKA